MKRALVISILTICASLFCALVLLPTPSSLAANGANFNPGNIIDDSVFYNDSSLNVNEIQTFLNAKNPSCDTYGTQSASDWGYPNITHAQLAEYKRNGTNGFSQDSGFHAPPYTCLKDYSQSTPQMEASSGYCGPLSAGQRNAAQIIKDVASACGINPKVLIVLLEKEQSLVMDNWPLQRQYRNATGFACPDTAPCDPAYNGFFYQVFNAARQFKVYQANPLNYNYIAGRTNRIYWHPDLSRCGNSQVYIENQATAALYIYTPYRPNDAALNNLYGTGDSCSSYGNRNFWRIFTDWFGTTHARATFVGMDTTRWMKVPANMYKRDVNTGETVGFELWSGLDIKFTSKTYVNNVLYLRSEYDTVHGNNYGIPFNSLVEINPTTIPAYFARVTQDTKKTDPLFNTGDGSTISKDTVVSLYQSLNVNGTLYYRSTADKTNQRGWIPASALEISSFVAFEKPRFMNIKNPTNKINVSTLQHDAAYTKGQQLFFDAKIFMNNQLYFRTKDDSLQSSPLAIPASEIEEVSISKLQNPLWLTIAKQTEKHHLDTLSKEGTVVGVGRVLKITGQAMVNDQTYLQTEFDDANGNLVGLPASAFHGVTYTNMETPRSLVLKSDSAKLNPYTSASWARVFSAGTTISFNQKIYLNNRLYVRSVYDSTYGNAAIIPYDLLEETN